MNKSAAQNGFGGSGGAIYVSGGTPQMEIQGCEFSANNASDVGGALCYEAAAELTVSSSLISGNWAAYGGGALSVYGTNRVGLNSVGCCEVGFCDMVVFSIFRSIMTCLCKSKSTRNMICSAKESNNFYSLMTKKKVEELWHVQGKIKIIATD